MKLPAAAVDELVVRPGAAARLAGRSTAGLTTDAFGDIGRASAKELLVRDLDSFKAELARVQEVLYASDQWAVLVILQGLDASGKDGTIKHVMSGVNPQGCQVVSFGPPSATELRHDFLWRVARALPERGRIGVFNRSHYEEVLVARVHPEVLEAQRLPDGTTSGERLWEERYESINAFERHLVRNGTRIVKLYLHLSEEEQRRRLLARLDDPKKQWKLSAADVRERRFFGAYRDAYERMITATSTAWAPWHVVPADHKPAMRALVGGIVVDAVDRLDLRYPSVGEAQAVVLARARRALEPEAG